MTEAVERAVRLGDRVGLLFGPVLDLATRIWLAQSFVVHAVAAMAASTGRPLAVIAEGVVLPLLLAFGLATRPAALLLLLVLAMGQATGLDLLRAALLGWLLVFGPGPFALDRALGEGLGVSALPLVRTIGSLYRAMTVAIGPIYRVALRVWLAAAPTGMALAALGVSRAMAPGSGFLPRLPHMMAALPPWAALVLSACLALGLLTRPVALILMLLVPIGQVAPPYDDRLYWLLLLAIPLILGPGRLSLDALLFRTRPMPDLALRPHVIIVGGGFGGIAAAEGLRRAPCRVTLVDRHNYTLFQPLLYQVATAGLSPADIATPIRETLRTQADVRVLLAEVTGVDLAGRKLVMGRSQLDYDFLVIATGAQHSYFGHEEWAAAAPGLKGIDDAILIRSRLLLAFEAAEAADDADERREWLTFVVIGGGPTGVELAGAIAELAASGFTGEFRRIDPASARVVLVQGGDRVLPGFPPSLSAAAMRSLAELKVEVILNLMASRIDDRGVQSGDTAIATRTVLWAAGVAASPAGRWLGADTDKPGRVKVAPDLSVPGHPEVFVIGDTALSESWNGNPAPGLAPAAKQGGAYVARVIRARLAERPPPGPFRYKHYGSLATIGRQSAVADFGFIRVSGAPAWWLWGVAHIAFLVSARNRVGVTVQWLWAYLTFRRSTRLITGTDRPGPG